MTLAFESRQSLDIMGGASNTYYLGQNSLFVMVPIVISVQL